MTRILIAEDDPDVARLLTEAIAERADLEGEIVLNGALVPDSLARRRPDLLILDLGLPGLSGMDVFDLVRNDAAYRGIPVLFLTARPDTARTAFAPSGEHRVIAKPFDVDDLMRTIVEMTSVPGAEAAA